MTNRSDEAALPAGVKCRLAEHQELAWVQDLQARTHQGRSMPAATLRHYIDRVDDRALAVAVSGGHPAGYLMFRAAHAPRLIDVAVEPALRRRGVATCLLLPLLTLYPEVTGVARDTCLAGHLLLRSLGFRCLRVLPRHFARPDADGYYFLRPTPGSTKP